eukprot:scaffold57667_cov58-Phaeocystis_antarctica.AAC.1
MREQRWWDGVEREGGGVCGGGGCGALGGGASGDHVHHGRLDLEEAVHVEEAAHEVDDLGARHEDVARRCKMHSCICAQLEGGWQPWPGWVGAAAGAPSATSPPAPAPAPAAASLPAGPTQGPAGRLVHMPRTGVEDEVEVALAVARLLVDQTCAERGLG